MFQILAVLDPKNEQMLLLSKADLAQDYSAALE